MNRNGLQLLLIYLNYSDNSLQSSDGVYKIRAVLDHFNCIVSNNYVRDKNLCIDKLMILWYRRLFLKQKQETQEWCKRNELCISKGVILKIKSIVASQRRRSRWVMYLKVFTPYGSILEQSICASYGKFL